MCNKDCFNCPYDDCINDEINERDYEELAEAEKIAGIEKPKKKKKSYSKEKKLQYYYEHRDHIREYKKQYYLKNRERFIEYRRNYYQDHHEEILKKQREKQRLRRLSRLDNEPAHN